MASRRNKSKTGAPSGARRRARARWGAAVGAGALLLLAAILVPQFMAAARHARPPAPGALTTPAATAHEGMVWVPGDEFWMGDDGFADARPVHRVFVDGFWLDRTEVTNAQFARFVAETGYVTVAEKPPDWEQMKLALPPGTPKPPDDQLVAGSLVFTPPAGPVPLDEHYQWWRYVPGASWRQPDGPGSTIDGKDNYPVVHVCYEDAVAYAKWARKRLPTEAEWELAARGGLDRKPYAWGDEQKPRGRWLANIWQGRFPAANTEEDGFPRTAPVASFPGNAFGLHDMAGNVWEWCADWYRPDYYTASPGRNPTGPTDSFDPMEPGLPKRVQRGGSFLCSDLYCVRYKPGTRGKGEVTSGASHVGFRCARSAS